MSIDQSIASKIPPLPAPPKTAAIRRFTEVLVARGHHLEGAQAIARAVCDPAAARRQLEEPGELRVDGGVLETVQTAVWLPAVSLYPTNPRVLPAFAYPAEGRQDRRAPLRNLESSPDRKAPELLLPAMSPAELTGVLDAHLEFLRRTNNLSESIGNLGIREPLLLVAMRVTVSAKDATESSTDHSVLAAVDGSSRVSAAYEHLGLDPAEVIFKLAPNERLLRQRIAAVRALADRPIGALSDTDKAALRSLVVPATIIVGFRADDRTATLADAIASRLGILHVEPPHPWSNGSKFDVQLDVALRALLDAERIAPGEFEWLSGHLDPEQATAAGFSNQPDVRAAFLLETLGKRDTLTSRAIRTITAHTHVSAEQRAAIVAEGALRSFRSTAGDNAAQAARSLLAALYRMPELDKQWSIDTAPGRLTNHRRAQLAALKELEDLGAPGPRIRCLVVLASYWLARYRVVPRQTRGGQEDRRDITTVIGLMTTSRHGVRQLYQIVIDGRHGRQPRQIDATGELIVSAAGEHLDVDDHWLRSTWPAPGKGPNADEPALSAEAVLELRKTALAEQFNALERAVSDLDDPRVGGDTPLVQSVGLAGSFVEPLVLKLIGIQGRLAELKRVADQAQPTKD